MFNNSNAENIIMELLRYPCIHSNAHSTQKEEETHTFISIDEWIHTVCI